MKKDRFQQVVREKRISEGGRVTIETNCIKDGKIKPGWVSQYFVKITELTSYSIKGHKVNLDDYEKDPQKALADAQKEGEKTWFDCEIVALRNGFVVYPLL